MTDFRERQSLRCGYEAALVALDGLVGAGLLVSWLFDPSGNVLDLALGVFLVLLFGFLLSVRRATATVFDDRVEVRYGWWWLARRIRLRDIVSSECLTWDFINQGPLWHNRQLVSRYGLASPEKGASTGVLVVTTDGKGAYLLSERPDELLQAIDAAKHALPLAVHASADSAPVQ